MQDPSTSTPFPSRPTSPSLSPSPRSSPAWPSATDGLLGYRLLSGTGEELGRVLGVENDRHGAPKKLCFLEEDGSAPRYVPLRFVRRIGDGYVELAGPRQGYHITRVRAGGRAMAEPDEGEEDDAGTWGAT